jgi:hypothetical protein
VRVAVTSNGWSANVATLVDTTSINASASLCFCFTGRSLARRCDENVSGYSVRIVDAGSMVAARNAGRRLLAAVMIMASAAAKT